MQGRCKNSLFEILDGISNINENLQGLGYEDYRSSQMTLITVVDNFEKILETIHFMPDGDKEDYPEIPWGKIEGLKNNLLHPLHGVDEEGAWKTAKVELRDIKDTIHGILQDRGDRDQNFS